LAVKTGPEGAKSDSAISGDNRIRHGRPEGRNFFLVESIFTLDVHLKLDDIKSVPMLGRVKSDLCLAVQDGEP
jgi:hypothetical protein